MSHGTRAVFKSTSPEGLQGSSSLVLTEHSVDQKNVPGAMVLQSLAHLLCASVVGSAAGKLIVDHLYLVRINAQDRGETPRASRGIISDTDARG